jgi:hypothetical protein
VKIACSIAPDVMEHAPKKKKKKKHGVEKNNNYKKRTLSSRPHFR